MLSPFSERRETIGRWLTSTKVSPEDAIIAFDDQWERFRQGLPATENLSKLGNHDLASLVGIAPDIFDKMITDAVRHWRVSPSRSFINLLRNVPEASAGGPMFKDIFEQSRILASGMEIGALPKNRGSFMRALVGNDKKHVMVSSDAVAMTAVEEGIEEINRLARGFAAWAARNAARVATQEVKLPKTLYRGVRGVDVELPGIEIEKDTSYFIRSCRVAAARKRVMSETPFDKVSGSPILSFTANESIAEFFTRDEGFIVAVDPRDVEIIASWSTDEALAGKDVVLNRHEREWIVRVPKDMALEADQVRIHDRTWNTAFGLPQGIAMLHHNDRVATYDLDGRRVTARWVYKSTGVGGSIWFSVDDSHYDTRAGIKRTMGFDPLPDPSRYDAVTNLQFLEINQFRGTRTEMERLDPRDFEPETGAAPGLC